MEQFFFFWSFLSLSTRVRRLFYLHNIDSLNQRWVVFFTFSHLSEFETFLFKSLYTQNHYFRHMIFDDVKRWERKWKGRKNTTKKLVAKKWNVLEKSKTHSLFDFFSSSIFIPRLFYLSLVEFHNLFDFYDRKGD